MATCYREDVVTYCKSQKGTKEGSNNWNIYAKELDAVNYFKPQKKQGVPWCSIYCDACVYNASNKDKAYTQKILYQPSYDNLSAGVTYVVDYFKRAGAWTTDANKVQVGDWVIFNSVNNKGKVTSYYTHIGIVIARDSKGITTSEGNKSNQVSECQYQFTAIGSKIAGFGLPKYDKKPEPTPPTPPTPTPTSNTYQVVNIRTFLAIRSTPENLGEKNKVGELKNGAVVTVDEIKNGWAKISAKLWVSTTYLKKI